MIRVNQEKWQSHQQGELRKHHERLIQKHMDTTVNEARNYDGILSLCSYATDPDPTFAAEGQAGVEWRSAVWKLGYQLMDEVEAGTREIPSESELIGMLPAMQWPTTEEPA